MRRKTIRKNLSLWLPVKKNKVHVSVMRPKSAVTTFQQAMRAPLFVGQLFSLMPVVGVTSNDARNVKFFRTSWKCLYSLLTLIGQTFMVVLCINGLANSHASLNTTLPIIFYVTTCVTMAQFVLVAHRWPALVQHIARTEEADPHFSNNLTTKCNITCAVFLMMGLLEHTLSLLSAFASASVCIPNKSTYEAYVTHSFPWVFKFLPYSLSLGIILQFLHFQSAVIWSFSDLFVISMSYYLTSRLEQVNGKLLAAQGKYLPEIFWRATREAYCRITQLVRKFDDVISGVVFISFANNLCSICLQLFNMIEYGLGTGVCGSNAKKNGQLGGREATTYFIFSLVYLLSRFVAVSLIASHVNSASSKPAPVLYDVPSPVYCVEVQRFLDQVNGEKVALSGLQFFIVTRELLLSVAGTIVTYELVMFQFNSPSSSSSQNFTALLPPAITVTQS